MNTCKQLKYMGTRKPQTFGSAGLVENLSLLSPCSSYNRTTLSTVHTANLALLGDQAMHVTFAAPSWTKGVKIIDVS